jgi:large subunit ribosomal protein L17
MRHRKEGRKFHRTKGQRQAFVRSILLALLKRGKIETTEARAKSIRPMAERAITIAKKGGVANRRLLLARLHDKKIVQKLMDDIGPRYADRKGGYARITKLAKTRKRDATRLVSIELV